MSFPLVAPPASKHNVLGPSLPAGARSANCQVVDAGSSENLMSRATPAESRSLKSKVLADLVVPPWFDEGKLGVGSPLATLGAREFVGRVRPDHGARSIQDVDLDWRSELDLIG